MRAHVIPDGREKRYLQPVRALEYREAAITLRDFFLFLLAHLMWVVEPFEEFGWVFDAIDAKIQIVNILITGPQPRRFVRRISAIGCQRQVRLAADHSWRRRSWFCRSPRGARANDVEAKSGSSDCQID